LGVWLAVAASIGWCKDDGQVVIEVQDGQTVRDIAATHLGDPDLWEEILRQNDIGSVTDIRPGLKLRLPSGRIFNANRALHAALAAIHQANEQGARLFAPEPIEAAIKLYNEGVAYRARGGWEEAQRSGENAAARAAEAFKISLQRRDSSAEALLSDRQGWVEGQKPQEIVWSDRSLNTILTEQEKVRTLSSSSAQITFRDNGRLRLNANSQAVILRMRVDPLSRREEAKVSLIEGDFYTALPGKSQRKTFELQIPEVQTEIASRNFWVRSDAAGSKFANYDGEVLRIAAKDESVDLGRNEAVLVRRGKAPSEKKRGAAASPIEGTG
jgi:hypothetical protein